MFLELASSPATCSRRCGASARRRASTTSPTRKCRMRASASSTWSSSPTKPRIARSISSSSPVRWSSARRAAPRDADRNLERVRRAEDRRRGLPSHGERRGRVPRTRARDMPTRCARTFASAAGAGLPGPHRARSSAASCARRTSSRPCSASSCRHWRRHAARAGADLVSRAETAARLRAAGSRASRLRRAVSGQQDIDALLSSLGV